MDTEDRKRDFQDAYFSSSADEGGHVKILLEDGERGVV